MPQSLETGSLTELEARMWSAREAGWFVTSRDSSVSAHQGWGYRYTQPGLAFYVAAEDSSAGPHSCRANTPSYPCHPPTLGASCFPSQPPPGLILAAAPSCVAPAEHVLALPAQHPGCAIAGYVMFPGLTYQQGQKLMSYRVLTKAACKCYQSQSLAQHRLMTQTKRQPL